MNIPNTANVHHLELFYYVAKYEGITAAVRRMPYGIQQPAVSGQILQLEEALELKLFNRRPFALTEEGKELYYFIEPFFSGLPKAIARICGETHRHLRIAASASIMSLHLPDVLAELRATDPQLKISLREVAPGEAEELLCRDVVDISLTALDGKPAPGLRAETLLEIPTVLLVDDSSPFQTFADIKKSAGENGAVGVPLIGMPPAELISKRFQRELTRHGLVWETAMQVHRLDLVETYVSRGFGIGLYASVPGRPIPEGTRMIALPKFPKLQVTLMHLGKLKPAAASFAEIVRGKASLLEGLM